MSLSPSAETAKILADGLIAAGLDRLPWSKALKQWRDRVMFLRKAEGENWPDLSDAALAATSDDWLAPALYDKTSLKDFSAGGLSDAVLGGTKRRRDHAGRHAGQRSIALEGTRGLHLQPGGCRLVGKLAALVELLHHLGRLGLEPAHDLVVARAQPR